MFWFKATSGKYSSWLCTQESVQVCSRGTIWGVRIKSVSAAGKANTLPSCSMARASQLKNFKRLADPTMRNVSNLSFIYTEYDGIKARLDKTLKAGHSKQEKCPINCNKRDINVSKTYSGSKKLKLRPARYGLLPSFQHSLPDTKGHLLPSLPPLEYVRFPAFPLHPTCQFLILLFHKTESATPSPGSAPAKTMNEEHVGEA